MPPFLTLLWMSGSSYFTYCGEKISTKGRVYEWETQSATVILPLRYCLCVWWIWLCENVLMLGSSGNSLSLLLSVSVPYSFWCTHPFLQNTKPKNAWNSSALRLFKLDLHLHSATKKIILKCVDFDTKSSYKNAILLHGCFVNSLFIYSIDTYCM